MRKIILESPPTNNTPVLVEHLDGRGIVAYRTAGGGDSVCILAKVTRSGADCYGFINIQSPTSHPVFCSASYYESVKLAMGRNPVYFDNQKDFIEAVYHKRF